MTRYKIIKWYLFNIFYYFGIKSSAFVGIAGIDKNVADIIGKEKGFFLEVGANDGFTFSNTLGLERHHNWHGLLIEPVPYLYHLCRRFRPKATVINAALGPRGSDGTMQQMLVSDLHSAVQGARRNSDFDVGSHVNREVENFTFQPAATIDVRTRELSILLDELNVKKIDLAVIDVEGFEVEVLDGIDFERHRPDFILIESFDLRSINEKLSPYYDLIKTYGPHDHLFSARRAPPKKYN